jgi:hypothetical protein
MMTVPKNIMRYNYNMVLASTSRDFERFSTLLKWSGKAMRIPG